MAVASLYLLLLLFAAVLSVNKDNFKTCDQSGFCKRQRAMQPGSSPYVVLMNALSIKPTSIEVQLLNKNNNVRLLLQLFAIKDNMARLKINELQPIKQRYEIPVGDVLIGEPKQQDLKVLQRSENSITLGFEKNKVVLTAEPFRIDFLTDDEPVISVNAQGLLKFEHYRQKKGEHDWRTPMSQGVMGHVYTHAHHEEPPKSDSPPLDIEDGEPAGDQEEQKKEGEEQQEGENAEENKAEGEKKEEKKEEEEPGMWAEDFKNFHDSKPHGPSSVGLDISFPGFENVYGIPEHAETMALKTTKTTDPYRLFNLDVFEYDLYNPMALYGSVPVMLAHNEKRTVGIFWHNAAETWIDISSNTADKSFFTKMADLVKGGNEIPQTDTHWFSEAGVIDVFFMLGPSVKDVFQQYAQLTGTTNLPHLFGIAYHQCRWNYNDETDVKNVEASFDELDIPVDVIWLDIEHTDGKRYFTWAGDKFPHSVEMINNLAAKGRKLVTIVDPHLKKDDNYKVYADAKSKDYYVKSSSGGEYDGWCWPGSSSWPDFVNPDIRKWWASKFNYNEYVGSTPDLYTWNDMNEPSVFNGPEITFHKDVLHSGGWENRDLHNLYGFYVHQATAEGQLLRSESKERIFVLTRAFFAGSQRFGAVWTGDNLGEWGHLKASNPMLLTHSLVGITHIGADVGGFFKNPDPELLTRWYQAGAYQPFFRAHAHLDTNRREPYLMPEHNMKIIRDAIRARYSYLPYWYTLFYEGEQKGYPVMRPLWVEYPSDHETFKMDDEYLIGPSLLVKPITEPGQTSTIVYFPGPKDIWYDINTYTKYHGGQRVGIDAPLDKIPVYQKGGSIIPRKMRIRRSSALMVHDPFTFVVCLDAEGKANGSLFVDDYHSFNYRKGDYLLREFIFANNEFKTQTGDRYGAFNTKEWVEKVVIIGLKHSPDKVTLKTKDEERPLHFVYTVASQELVIRKPGVNISTDFTIKLS